MNSAPVEMPWASMTIAGSIVTARGATSGILTLMNPGITT
jgi:hypothetical protein